MAVPLSFPFPVTATASSNSCLFLSSSLVTIACLRRHLFHLSLQKEATFQPVLLTNKRFFSSMISSTALCPPFPHRENTVSGTSPTNSSYCAEKDKNKPSLSPHNDFLDSSTTDHHAIYSTTIIDEEHLLAAAGMASKSIIDVSTAVARINPVAVPFLVTNATSFIEEESATMRLVRGMKGACPLAAVVGTAYPGRCPVEDIVPEVGTFAPSASKCPFVSLEEEVLGGNLKEVAANVAGVAATATVVTNSTITRSCPMENVIGGTITASTGIKTCPVMAVKSLFVSQRWVNFSRLKMSSPFLNLDIINSMGKAKLNAFVAFTATCGYVVAGGTSPLLAAIVTLGTYLQGISAATGNQIREREWDKLMKRTKRRALPRNLLTLEQAKIISAVEGVTGTGLLLAWFPMAAVLGAANWVIYVMMYTPLKRVSAMNTWLGAIVGGIPPLMGAVAATGTLKCALPGIMGTLGGGAGGNTAVHVSSATTVVALGASAMGPAYLLAAFMLSWQIPHFMALAFHCRRDYESAGFKMLAFYNPWRASMWSVLFSVIMALITILGPHAVGWPLEGIWYYPLAIIASTGMIYKAVLFHIAPVKHCVGCFIFSYAYLSVMLAALALNHWQPMHKVTALLERLQQEVDEESQKKSYY